MISAMLPFWIIGAPAIYLIIDAMTAPKSSCYSGIPSRRDDQVRAVPPHQTDRVKPL